MKKGKTPYFILLILPLFGLLSYQEMLAQSKALQLSEVEIIEELERRHESVKSFQFDSLDRIGFQLDAGDFLSRNSGVFIKDYGPGSTSTMSFRGNSANHTKVYWDGISVDNVMLGQSDMSLYSLDPFGQTSFLKGGHSLELGSGGFGGALNMTNEVSDWNSFSLSAGVTYGSFNTRQIPIRFQMGNGKFQFRLTASQTNSDNDFNYVNEVDGNGNLERRENAAFNRLNIMPELSWKVSERSALSVSYWHTESNREVPAPIGIPHGNAFQTDRWNRGLLKYRYDGRKTDFSIKSSYQVDEMYYDQQLLGIDSDNKTRSLKNMIEVSHQLIKYLDAELQLRYDRIGVESNNYSELEQMDVWSAYPSLSYTRSRYYAKTAARIENSGNRGTYTMPNVDLGWRPLQSSSDFWVFLNANINSRYPTFNELYWQNAGNANLSREEARSFELGMDKDLIRTEKGSLALQASYFYSEVSDMIAWFPDAGNVWIPQNLNSVMNRGLECGLKAGTSGEHWKLLMNAGYIYTRSTVIDSEALPELEGKQQIYVPEHKAHVSTSLTYQSYFVNYTQNFNGSTYVTTDNEENLPYSTPAEAEVGKKFGFGSSGLIVSLRIRNLYNENYQFVLHQPMPLRHYMLTIQYLISK